MLRAPTLPTVFPGEKQKIESRCLREAKNNQAPKWHEHRTARESPQLQRPLKKKKQRNSHNQNHEVLGCLNPYRVTGTKSLGSSNALTLSPDATVPPMRTTKPHQHRWLAETQDESRTAFPQNGAQFKLGGSTCRRAQKKQRHSTFQP